MALSHPIQRRYLAEDLTRLRRADEQARYAASQRQGRIDPNPHQVDAVIFALRRIPEGGCILADEVGLGKTIEAGLVMAQLRAEGARRILVILPKPLVGQWQHELYALFGLESVVDAETAEAFAGPGIYLVGRELAGGSRGSHALSQVEPFDLVVIDEAHEIFAGIYRRYDRDGYYQDDSPHAITAHRVRRVLGRTPVLLLTATPIQNSLAELWGLVQYVEPTGTLLGDLKTFRDVFCDGDDRTLVPGQAHELKRRIGTVLQRTLRRQAKDFLERPFVDRRCLRFEYGMSAEERSLYDDVTDYLLESELFAFAGSQRRLLLIGFHRRMASSIRALAVSLERVVQRLERLRRGEDPGEALDVVRGFADDLEDDTLLEDPDAGDVQILTLVDSAVAAEQARVQSFAARCHALACDSKAERLLDALRLIDERAGRGQSRGKAVIFTESLATQDYLRELLLENGYRDGELTLFRGQNDSERAKQALAVWNDEVGDKIPAYRRPSRQVAVRLALVHEFATRSRFFISTEAGGKGLNLQFCDTVINYDLPWNPQRIEQRIGRCHRYSQERDVTVINFVNRDNEAERLAFEILSQKLELFGTVLDASDQVIYRPSRAIAPETLVGAMGSELENARGRIVNRARSRAEMDDEMAALAETIESRRQAVEERYDHMAGLIESRFDAEVRKMFRRFEQLRSDLQDGLAQLDRDLRRLITEYLQASGVDYELVGEGAPVLIDLAPSDSLPEDLAAGGRFAVGDSKGAEGADPIHLGHPLVRAAVEESRRATEATSCVRFEVGSDLPRRLRAAIGRRGRLWVHRVAYRGFEPSERLLATALLEGDDEPLADATAKLLLSLPTSELPAADPPLRVDDEDLRAALEETLFIDRIEVEASDQESFERAMAQIERHVEDRALVLRRRRARLEQSEEQSRHKRDGALGSASRERAQSRLVNVEREREAIDTGLADLAARRDERYETWRDQLYERRYRPPEVTPVLDVTFELVAE